MQAPGHGVVLCHPNPPSTLDSLSLLAMVHQTLGGGMVLGPVHLLGLAGEPTGWLTVDTGGAGTVPIPPALALLNLLVAVGRPVSPVGAALAAHGCPPAPIRAARRPVLAQPSAPPVRWRRVWQPAPDRLLIPAGDANPADGGPGGPAFLPRVGVPLGGQSG